MRKFITLLLCLLLSSPCFAFDHAHHGRNVQREPWFRSLPPGLTFAEDFTKGTDTASLQADFALGSQTATFTRAACSCTYIGSDGLLHLVTAADTPRFAGGFYDATGFHSVDSNGKSAKGLMIEGERKNLLVNGAFDTNTTWSDGVSSDVLKYGAVNRWNLYVNTGGSTATTVNTISTDSLYSRSASIQVTNAGAATSDIQFSNANTLSLANATTYTVSFFVKCSAAVAVTYNISETDDDYTIYNALGTFNTVADTWIYISKAFTGLAGGLDVTDARFAFFLGNLGTFTFQVEGLQLEAGPYATSFIPTTTGAVERKAETLKYAISGNRTAAQETIAIQWVSGFTNGASISNKYLLSTSSPDRQTKYGAAGDFRHIPNAASGSCTTAFNSLSTSINTSYILTLISNSVSSPYAEYFLDGIDAAKDETADTYTVNAWEADDYMFVGSNNGGTEQISGIVKKVCSFNRILSSSEKSSLNSLLNT